VTSTIRLHRSQDTPEPPSNPGRFSLNDLARSRNEPLFVKQRLSSQIRQQLNSLRILAFHIFATRPLSAVESIGLATEKEWCALSLRDSRGGSRAVQRRFPGAGQADAPGWAFASPAWSPGGNRACLATLQRASRTLPALRSQRSCCADIGSDGIGWSERHGNAARLSHAQPTPIQMTQGVDLTATSPAALY